MSKLLSDEELIDEISKIPLDTQIAIIDEYKPLLDLINTQKRLYAEMVVGQDEKEILIPAKPRQGLPTKDGIAVMRNKLRAEQRARIE